MKERRSKIDDVTNRSVSRIQGTHSDDEEDDQRGEGLASSSSWRTGLVSMRGRSLASSGSSPSSSAVLTLMQEQRSREAKKAETTLPPTQFATPSSLSYVVTMLWELSSVAILPDPSMPGFAFSAASVLRGLTEIRRPNLRITEKRR
ncbi:unnamed protein product, partial [Musa acuminata var. zebrina]